MRELGNAFERHAADGDNGDSAKQSAAQRAGPNAGGIGQ